MIGFIFISMRFGIGKGYPLENFAEWIGFILLFATVIFTTAAGNFINDYFDRKVDAINKPNKNEVDINVKRRVVILAHISTNLLALLCAAGAGYINDSWMPVFITPVIILLLTAYTPWLKKRYFLGNLLVAICVGILPIWALWPEIIRTVNSDVQFWALVYCLFGFLLTFSREIVKDLEDMDGDEAEGYKTIPVVSGIRTAKGYALFSLLISLFLASMAFMFQVKSQSHFTQLTYLVTVAAPILICFIALIVARSKSGFTRASGLLKLAMILGISFSLINF
jgi:4-hydroxybenzoate polyprenyltransferase